MFHRTMKRAGIQQYFTRDGQRVALRNYIAFAHRGGWPVSEKMRLYVASHNTFGPSSATEEDRRESFEQVYKSLSGRGWQAFRPRKQSQCWSARKILSVLRRDFSHFGSSGASLMDAFDDRKQRAMISALESIRGIKPKNGYPHMTVSKFLHFFNPSLFPIYDGAIIDRRVFGAFNDDYATFCRDAGLDANSADVGFLRNYVCWAASLVQAAGPHFMKGFERWMLEQLSAEKYGAVDSYALSTLYATAFEFTAIGAALAEGA